MATYEHLNYQKYQNNEYAIITSVDDYAFEHFSSLEVHPDTQFVSKNACENMPNLMSLYFNEGLLGIGSEAFANCRSLSQVELPSSLTAISRNAFEGCNNIDTVVVNFAIDESNKGFLALFPTAQTIIVRDEQSLQILSDDPAFANKNTLVVTSNSEEWAGVLKKASITSSDLRIDNISFIEERAVAGSHSLKHLVLGPDVETIEREAFNNCKNLETVHIGEWCSDIGYGAFGRCEKLREFSVEQDNTSYFAFDGSLYTKDMSLVRYPVGREDEIYDVPLGVLKMEEGAFALGRHLREVWLPEGFQEIAPFSFSGCTNLQQIQIPESVTYVGYNAFSNCLALKEIELPAFVTVDEDAFEGCKSLERVKVGEHVIEIHNEQDLTNLHQTISDIQSGIVVSNSNMLSHITSDFNVFVVNSNELQQAIINDSNVKIPEGVDFINNNAFRGNNNIQHLYIGDGVERIGYDAFGHCENLETIHIGKDVVEINDTSFASCIRLSSIDVDERNQYFHSSDGNLYSSIDNCLKRYAIGKPELSFTVPEGINGISDAAFASSRLESITLPDGLKQIGDAAFCYCENLKKINIPDSVEYIGFNAFSWSGIEEIQLPLSAKVDDSAFRGCEQLRSVIVGDHVINITNEDDLKSLGQTIRTIQEQELASIQAGMESKEQISENTAYVSDLLASRDAIVMSDGMLLVGKTLEADRLVVDVDIEGIKLQSIISLSGVSVIEGPDNIKEDVEDLGKVFESRSIEVEKEESVVRESEKDMDDGFGL